MRARHAERQPARVPGVGRALLLAALFLAPALASGQEAGPPSPPRIGRIEFQGATAISAGKLRDQMLLKQKSWWKPFQKNYFLGADQLERDLERVLALYRDEGYLLARAVGVTVTQPSPERVDLTIALDEGIRAYVRDLTVAGAPGSVVERAEERLAEREGEPLREALLTGDELFLQTLCEEEGYALASVTREVRFIADSVDVILWVEAGPRVRVGEIEIAGLTRTKSTVVRREIRLAPGDYYRRSRALTSQERLFDLGLFRTVRIVPVPADSLGPRLDQPEITMDLRVTLAEKAPGWYGFGLGLSSADQLRLIGEWGYRNLMGRARALQATGVLSYALTAEEGVRRAGANERQIELVYTEPWVIGPLWGQLRTYAHFNREATFEEEILGLVLGARRDLNRFDRLFGSIENKWVSTTDTTVAQADYQTRFLSLSFSADRRDFALDPHRGSYFLSRGEFAGGFLGGAASFGRGVANASLYFPLAPRATWALRVRGGAIHPIGSGVAGEGEESDLLRVPFEERFRAGGGTTVRGYAEGSLGPYSGDGQALGGLALALFNAELRFPLIWEFAGAFFLDAGNVWEDFSSMTASNWLNAWKGAAYSPHDVAYGFGGGLRFHTPVGPLRLDYGIKVGRGRPGTGQSEWHFSLGQAF
jgi:outer membrane protein assembly complex protein YaeT